MLTIKRTKYEPYHRTRCRINFRANPFWWAQGTHMPPEWMIVLDLAKLQWFTFSTSTFLLKNRFIPRARGRAKTRAARYFLKAIVAILELEASDASIRSERYLLYPFCERFVDCVLGLHRRDSYQDSTPLSHSSESKMQAPNSLRNCPVAYLLMLAASSYVKRELF